MKANNPSNVRNVLLMLLGGEVIDIRTEKQEKMRQQLKKIMKSSFSKIKLMKKPHTIITDGVRGFHY